MQEEKKREKRDGGGGRRKGEAHFLTNYRSNQLQKTRLLSLDPTFRVHNERSKKWRLSQSLRIVIYADESSKISLTKTNNDCSY